MSSGLSEFSLEDGKCLTESLRYKLEVNRLVSLFVFIIIIHVKNVFSLSFGVTILDAHVHWMADVRKQKDGFDKRFPELSFFPLYH